MKSPNYDSVEFVNQHGVTLDFSFSQYLTMFKKLAFGDELRNPDIEIPIHKLSKADFANISEDDLLFTWINHSTVLLEIDGMRILTDPIWSERASPSSIFGPRRFHPVPLELDELPRIDAVIISHDHFDHLDRETVVKLSETGAKFITALGVGAHLEEWQVKPDQIIEIDWWDEYKLADDFTLVCTPSQHFSGRGFGSRNKTLWSTWVISGPKHRVFFCGDTGEISDFERIGDKYGPFDLTLMKIGAYGEMWPDIHLTPEQTVRLHQVLKGEVLMPIHWGSFNLAFHSWNEPIDRLFTVAQKSDVSFVTPYPGQRIRIDSLPAVEKWWLNEAAR